MKGRKDCRHILSYRDRLLKDDSKLEYHKSTVVRQRNAERELH